MIKTDSSGTLQWQKILGGTGGEVCRAIQQTTDGGYILTGPSGSSDYDVTGNHGSRDSWTVKIDNAGIIQWQKALGGNNLEDAFSLIRTFDGGYAIASYSDSNNGDVSGNHGSGDFWVVKLAPDVSIEKNNIESSTNLYPNPFSTSAVLMLPANNFSEGTIEIKNIFGATVSGPKHFSGNTIQIQRNSLPTGIYFYRITTKENETLNGKFIIE